jgi:A/G-specific adenine glycosylase
MRRNAKLTTENLKVRRLVPTLLKWFSWHARDLPWRRTRDPYAIWVSEIMLQQTQVKTVIPYWERWMRELPTIQSVAKASPAKQHKLWEGLGYYTRVRNMQKAAQQIVARHDGKFPKKYEDILALPGIGRYTAGAICSIAFNQPTPILDGNVVRVLTRVFGIEENPRDKETNARLWKLAEDLVGRALRCPPRRCAETTAYLENSCSHLNQSLMELGALVCTPRSPNCTSCPVKTYCIAFRQNRQDELPNLGKREAATARRCVAFVIIRNGKFLVRQRPNGVVNAHLWEFPNVEMGTSEGRAWRPVRADVPLSKIGGQTTAAPKRCGRFKITDTKPLCIIKHSITRYRIRLEAYRARSTTRSGGKIGIWRTPAQMRRLAFTAAHKRLASIAVERILSRR